MDDWEQYGRDVTSIYPSEALIRFYMKYLSTLNNPSLLEVGFGGGRNTRFLAEETSNLVAIDGSNSCYAKASSLMKKFNLNASLINADVREYDLGSCKYDAVIDVSTLQHLTFSELTNVIPNIVRSLKVNGFFFTVFKNVDDHVYTHGEALNRNTRRYSKSMEKLSNPCLLTFLSHSDIGDLFSGFKILEINSDRWTYNNGQHLNSHWIISAQKR